MKNILLLFVFLIGLQHINAQYVTIPDANFRSLLENSYPSCFFNGMMDTTCNEILNVTEINRFGSLGSRGIQSFEGVRYFKNLQKFDCSNNPIGTLPVLPASLKELYCINNQLSYLSNLPDSIKNLGCSQNNITTLPAHLSDSLKYLDCADNVLTTLPATLPSRLERLLCAVNSISALPVLPASLTYLSCESNLLTQLPVLNNNLSYLSCSNNRITNYSLPSTLNTFRCSGNGLDRLPVLPDSLVWLEFSNNNLSVLGELPNTIRKLYCYNNKLTSIMSLPENLDDFVCSFNHLTSLPPLPSKLRAIDCSNNQISSLPSLPSLNFRYLTIYNNPISCLPLLPAGIQYIELGDGMAGPVNTTNIICLPNAYSGSMNVSLPVCTDPLNICEVNPFVRGKVYIDLNNNNTYDTAERLIAEQPVKALPGNWMGTSDIHGSYLIKLDTVITNTWSAVNNLRYATITPASYTLSNIHTLGLQDSSFDFAVHMIANVYDLQTTLGSSPVRPGFVTNVSITINNAGTVNQSDVTIKLKKPNGFDVLAASITPTSIINDTLIWNNININYLERQSINIQLQVPVNAVLGSDAIYEAWSNGTKGDSTALDNHVIWIETIRGSFDPNDKLVNKESLPPTYNVDKDKLLYTIRFQNTGTDTAFTVIVRDEIPANLEVASLHVINASHPYQLIVREKNIVEVIFPNIQLPDSNVNEAKSHGFVQLEFKPTSGLPLNAEINNTAAIFFDYNIPVITNTATTKVQITTSIANNKKLAFKLFPNPAASDITVELPYTGIGKWYITDVTGKIILQNNIEDNTSMFDIDVSNITNGVYVFTVDVKGIISSSKIIVAR